MRVFIALDIDDAIRGRIARFAEGAQGFAPDARWAKPESLHVTLKFIGEQPEAAVAKIHEALNSIRPVATEIRFRGYGFFPTAKSARVFWLGIEAGANLSSLAKAVDDATASVGIPREDRPFSPHLTLARAPGGSGSPDRRRGDRPNRAFQHLQEKLSALAAPEFGTMTAREFFLYQSQLSAKGSKYTKIGRFMLKADGE